MNDRYLKLFLQFIGAVSLLAFAAAMMPGRWMIEIADELGLAPFPDHPLTFYLARNLSLMYGFVGLVLLIVASDLNRYRPLVRLIALGTIVFSGMQLIVDTMSGMPVWWTIGESASTIAGGGWMYWLDRRTLNSKDRAEAEWSGSH